MDRKGDLTRFRQIGSHGNSFFVLPAGNSFLSSPAHLPCSSDGECRCDAAPGIERACERAARPPQPHAPRRSRDREVVGRVERPERRERERRANIVISILVFAQIALARTARVKIVFKSEDTGECTHIEECPKPNEAMPMGTRARAARWRRARATTSRTFSSPSVLRSGAAGVLYARNSGKTKSGASRVVLDLSHRL